MEQELAPLQRAPQAALEAHALEAALIHLGSEELVEVTAGLARPVHCQLGVLDEGVRVPAVGVEDRNTSGRRDESFAIVEIERQRQGLQHPLHHRPTSSTWSILDKAIANSSAPSRLTVS